MTTALRTSAERRGSRARAGASRASGTTRSSPIRPAWRRQSSRRWSQTLTLPARRAGPLPLPLRGRGANGVCRSRYPFLLLFSSLATLGERVALRWRGVAEPYAKLGEGVEASRNAAVYSAHGGTARSRRARPPLCRALAGSVDRDGGGSRFFPGHGGARGRPHAALAAGRTMAAGRGTAGSATRRR